MLQDFTDFGDVLFGSVDGREIAGSRLHHGADIEQFLDFLGIKQRNVVAAPGAQHDKALRVELAQGPWRVDLDDNVNFYWFVAVITALAVIMMWRLVNAPFGHVLQAIRQNETRARFIGYDVWRWKWLVFTLSAGFAGLAGGLFAMAQQSAYPDVMSLHQSGLIVMMVLVGGGLVNFWGPVLGVMLYYVARDVLGGITEAWLLWYGLMFVIMVMLRPEGVAGLLDGLLRRRAEVAGSTVIAATKPEQA